MIKTIWVRDRRYRKTLVGAGCGCVVGVLGSHAAVSLATLLAPHTESTCESSGFLDCMFDNLGPALGAIYVFGLYVVLITGVLALLGGVVLTVALLRVQRLPSGAAEIATTENAWLVGVGVALLVSALLPVVKLGIGMLF